MPNTLTFNRITKDWLYLLDGRKESPFAPITNNLLNVPGVVGAHLTSSKTEVLYVTQPVGFVVQDDEHEQQILDELKGWLLTDKQVEFQFSDNPNRTYIGKIDGDMADYEKFVSLRSGTLTFLCKPYKYGPERIAELSNTTGTIINVEGTAPTKPIFEFDVVSHPTFIMISNGEEYMMIGRPAKIDEEEVEARTLLLEERGETIATWSETPTAVDNGVVSGGMGYDGGGITVTDYGVNQPAWHGPALIKEIPPAQDFEVEMNVELQTTNVEQTARIEFYLFDEGMNELGKMAIVDNSVYVHTKHAEGRVGSFAGGGYPLNKEYKTDFWNGVLKMKRVDDYLFFYVATLDDAGRHHNNQSDIFPANNLMGKLKYIQIHIGNYGSTQGSPSPEINLIKVHEINDLTVDQTPYIAQQGDKVIFDHHGDVQLLINGEDAKKHIDMGASPFSLKPGYNSLAMLPSLKLNGRVKWRDAYK